MKTQTIKTAKNVYICLSCAQVQTTTTFPPSEGCKIDSFHRWRRLGEEGKQRYHCKRCDATVNLNVQPVSVGCSTGTNHEWQKT